VKLNCFSLIFFQESVIEMLSRRYKCEKVNGNIESQVIAKADLAHPQVSIKNRY
jgi:hypothetical protein